MNEGGGVMKPRYSFPEKLEKDIGNILIKNCDSVYIRELDKNTYAIKDLEGIMFELLSYILPIYEENRQYKEQDEEL